MRPKYFYVLVVVSFFVNLFINAHDKWIVITTINYPTQALRKRKLAQLKDWRVVVVADRKTPKDWHLEGFDFLSVEQQEKLDFSIIKLLPWNHYSRKNIGYLYAIQHGAKIIYETDDDTILSDDAIEYLPEYIDGLLCTDNKGFVNPYAYFGQPSVWPRGYPLQKITTKDNLEFLHTSSLHIPIQQGLVNRDPDVDAIFRLTRGEYVYFDSTKTSLNLAQKVFAPFNSQNTTFYYDAFWALLLPISVAHRVTDIWRGYWMQRLLSDIGGHLSFLLASTIQYRNDHNLLKDFIDEYDLYIKSEELINFLISWKSEKETLSARMIDLMGELVTRNFFGQDDLQLVKAWLEDLEKCGYQFPQLNG